MLFQASAKLAKSVLIHGGKRRPGGRVSIGTQPVNQFRRAEWNVVLAIPELGNGRPSRSVAGGRSPFKDFVRTAAGLSQLVGDSFESRLDLAHRLRPLVGVEG